MGKARKSAAATPPRTRQSRKTPDPLWAAYHKHRTNENRNAIVLANLHIARIIAKKIKANTPANIDFDTLYSAACAGVIEAVEHYDYRRRVTFCSYATLIVRGRCLDELRHLDPIPRITRRCILQWTTAADALRTGLGREPTDHEIATRLGWSPRKVSAAVPVCKIVSMDTTSAIPGVSPESGGAALREAITARKETLPPSVSSSLGDSFQRLTRGMDLIPRMCLYLYYIRGLTMADTARVIGVCESRISQIVAAATKWLNEHRDRSEAFEDLQKD